MREYRIRNWTKFQHYKDRNPPWIKLHCEILASEDWVTLADASKLLAVVCMIIGAKNNGIIPNNPSYIRRVAYLDHTPDLTPLIDCGFLESVADASNMLADARPEKETQVRAEKESILSDKSDASKPKRARKEYPEAFQAFWEAYPTDKIMSKAEAFKAWNKLPPEGQAQAVAAIPAFKAWIKTQRDYRTIHACRFLSQGRFEGFQPDPSLSPEEIQARRDRADRLLNRGKYAEAAA